MNDQRLSSQDYWEQAYIEPPAAESPEVGAVEQMSRKKRLLLSLLGEKAYAALRTNYAGALAWNVLYRTYLPQEPGLKFLELGSAPGTILVRMKSEFGYEPFGIEYTENGVRQNKEMFARNGIDPENAIHADFLSDDVAARYANHFDIVYSGGLIEHFTNLNEVIDRHIELLAPGGTLMVDIPNLRGMNYAFTKALNGRLLDIHNLDIMDKRVFCSLFEKPSLERVYCDYYGTINFQLFSTDNRYLRRIVDRGLGMTQLLVNLLLDRVLMTRRRRLESRYTSPYLIYIGRKRNDA